MIPKVPGLNGEAAQAVQGTAIRETAERAVAGLAKRKDTPANDHDKRKRSNDT